MSKRQTVKVGDLFVDNDPRFEGRRTVRVVQITTQTKQAEVVNAEHGDETLIGRHSQVALERLIDGKMRATGFTKVSR